LAVVEHAGRKLLSVDAGGVADAGPSGDIQHGSGRAVLRLRLRARLWVATMAAVTNEEFARVVQARRQLRDLDARLAGRVESVTPLVAAMEAFCWRCRPKIGLAARNGCIRCRPRTSIRRQKPSLATSGRQLISMPTPCGKSWQSIRPGSSRTVANREPRNTPPDASHHVSRRYERASGFASVFGSRRWGRHGLRSALRRASNADRQRYLKSTFAVGIQHDLT